MIKQTILSTLLALGMCAVPLAQTHAAQWTGAAAILSADTPAPTPTPGAGGVVDDRDSSIIYSTWPAGSPNLGWNQGTGSGFYDNTQSYSDACITPVQSLNTVEGAEAVFNFTGTQGTFIGETGPNYGIGSYSIDGGAQHNFDAYSASNQYQVPLVNVTGLTNRSHVLAIQVQCVKNGSSSGYYQSIDAFQTDGSATPSSGANAYAYNYSNVSLNGSGWTCGTKGGPPEPVNGDLSGDHCWDGTAGDSVTMTAVGSLLEVFVRPDVGDGYMDIKVDGTLVAHNLGTQYTTVDNDQLDGYMVFAYATSPGSHSVQLIVDGSAAYPSESENSGQKNLVQFDELLAFP